MKVRVLALSIVSSLLLAFGIIAEACGGDRDAGRKQLKGIGRQRVYEVVW